MVPVSVGGFGSSRRTLAGSVEDTAVVSSADGVSSIGLASGVSGLGVAFFGNSSAFGEIVTGR